MKKNCIDKKTIIDIILRSKEFYKLSLIIQADNSGCSENDRKQIHNYLSDLLDNDILCIDSGILSWNEENKEQSNYHTFFTLFKYLYSKFPNQYILIVDGEIIQISEDFEKIQLLKEEKYSRRKCLLTEI